MSFSIISGKSRRLSRYEDEPSDGQLGINEKELNSMNKHIPGMYYVLVFLYTITEKRVNKHLSSNMIFPSNAFAAQAAIMGVKGEVFT